MIKSMPIKIIISFITIVLLVNIFYTPTSHAIGDIMGQGKGFLDASNGEESVINDTVLKTTSDSIYNTLLAMAIIIAVIVAMILGIQFMVAAADEKAKIKEALMPFVIGCIIVFGSFTVWKVFVDMGQSAEDSIEGVSVERPTDAANKDIVNNNNNNNSNNHNNNNVEAQFESWYNFYVGDEFIPMEGEEKAKNWSKREWREFWDYMMEMYGTPAGVLGIEYHLKEYIQSKY